MPRAGAARGAVLSLWRCMGGNGELCLGTTRCGGIVRAGDLILVSHWFHTGWISSALVGLFLLKTSSTGIRSKSGWNSALTYATGVEACLSKEVLHLQTSEESEFKMCKGKQIQERISG